MEVETLIVVVLLCGVTLLVAWDAARKGSRGKQCAIAAGWLAVVVPFAWLTAGYAPPVSQRQPPSDRPIELAHGGYVSSNACQSCHPAQYASWHRSYHRTMTQRATSDVFAGPTDAVVESRGSRFVLERRGDEVWVELDDPDQASPREVPAGSAAPEIARRVWRPIVQTTGSHSEQFYWISAGVGRNLALLPIMYRRLDEQRWTSLDGCCLVNPGAVQNLAAGRWNLDCSRCHTTHVLPGIEPGRQETDTKLAEFGIACEACHGPGADHIARNHDPFRRYQQHASGATDAAIVNPAKLDKQRASEVCGQCHSVQAFLNADDRDEWFQDGARYRPGDDLAESRRLMQTGRDRFWSDGMVRVSGREYNGLVESPCYLRGEMTCFSCHSLHKDAEDPRPLDAWADDQLHAGMDGDRACTQCHAELVGAEAVEKHTHHLAASSGSTCMNCHMPYTTFGLLKGIRSHQVSSPSVQESLATGRPNACNQCHLDRTAAWAGDHLQGWYGIPAPALDEDQRTVAASVLWALQGDAGQRVLMASSMGWDAARAASGSDWMTPLLLLLLQDPYSAVRYIAHRTLAHQQGAAEIAVTDPASPPADFQPAALAVLRAWAARPRPASKALLITDQGQSDGASIKRLLQDRNMQPVVLNE